MPFTYFAHQVPVLPLKMKAPDRWDGLGLVIGSIMPDLWYMTSGWLYGPVGMPLWVDGHRLDLIIQNCVIPGMIITILLRRWTMPVVPAVLPKAGFLRLRDYRLLALSKHRWWVTAYSVFVGALTHLVLDRFTHIDGLRIIQWVVSALGSVAGAYLLLVISRKKLQWAWHGYANRRPPDPVVREPGRAVILGALGVGTALALAYAVLRLGDGKIPAFMAFSGIEILVLLGVGLLGRRYVEPLGPAPLPAAVDPLVE